jgi:hypothetical protein
MAFGDANPDRSIASFGGIPCSQHKSGLTLRKVLARTGVRFQSDLVIKFTSARESKGGGEVNRGIIGTIIGVLVIIILVIVILQLT